MNKSYRIGYNFQRRVKKYLEKKNWNVIIQPRSKFPDITAWKPFVNKENTPIFLNTEFPNQESLPLVAFFVLMVECKVNKYLTKEEKKKTKELLLNNKCDLFLTAYRKNRKLCFYPLNITKQNTLIKKEDEEAKRYIG